MTNNERQQQFIEALRTLQARYGIDVVVDVQTQRVETAQGPRLEITPIIAMKLRPNWTPPDDEDKKEKLPPSIVDEAWESANSYPVDGNGNL